MSGLDDLYPRSHPEDPKLWITEFSHAYELHTAAEGLTLIRNRESKDARGVQRAGILDIARAVTLVERDKILDQFCLAWQAYRKRLSEEK